MDDPVFRISTEYPCDICGKYKTCAMLRQSGFSSSDICESCARAMVAAFDREREGEDES